MSFRPMGVSPAGMGPIGERLLPRDYHTSEEIAVMVGFRALHSAASTEEPDKDRPMPDEGGVDEPSEVPVA